MAEDFIQLPADSTGKAVQTFSNGNDGPSGAATHSQAYVMVDQFGNPVSLESLLQTLAIAVEALSNALAMAKDPTTGRLRIVQDGVAGTQQNVAIASGTVSAVTTVSDMTRLNNVGTNAGPVPVVPAQVPAQAQMQQPADNLRARITVS